MSKSQKNERKKGKEKKKTKKLFIIILLLVVIYVIGIAVYLKNSNNSNSSTTSQTNSSSNSSSTTTNVKVTTQTIEKTLSGSGQISSSKSEVLTLSTSKYFSEVYVEEGDCVKSGANLVKYTDGTYISAPYDCVISIVSVPNSGKKASGTENISIENVENLYMTLSVSETDINTVSVGQEATVTISAYSDRKYTGSITKISEIGTYSSSGSNFTATITFANDGDIKVGMSASCTVTLEKVENVIAVPNEAIQTKNNTKYVIVVANDETTSEVQVETGISNDAYTQIKSGLTGNETVQMTVTSTSSTTNGFNGGTMMQYNRGSSSEMPSQMWQGQRPSGGN